jgi:probable non-F420 flavinoid oxidoreductase
MVVISYHASHEQFSPRELLDLTCRAEQAGFDAAFSSDHLQPWVRSQGHAGHLWTGLGAALQTTRRLQFAAITIPGGWRYHPAIVAQALASLDDMFPGRLPWIALGSGEALNECVVSNDWPGKEKRNVRLRQAAEGIRRLLNGETVDQSEPVVLHAARLWPQRVRPIALIGAALSPETAASIAGWADGLLTTAGSFDALSRIVAAFRAVAPDKPMHAKIDISWAPSEEEALQLAHEQWAFSSLPGDCLAALRSPEEFEQAAEHVKLDDVRRSEFVSADPQRHIDLLRRYAALGFETLDIHNVGRNQRQFIDCFSREVLPALRDLRTEGRQAT